MVIWPEKQTLHLMLHPKLLVATRTSSDSLQRTSLAKAITQKLSESKLQVFLTRSLHQLLQVSIAQELSKSLGVYLMTIVIKLQDTKFRFLIRQVFNHLLNQSTVIVQIHLIVLA